MNLIFRKAEAKDAEEWQEFTCKVMREAYKDIFPEEVFAYQESKKEKTLRSLLTSF